MQRSEPLQITVEHYLELSGDNLDVQLGCHSLQHPWT